MDAQYYWDILKRRWYILVLVAIAAVGGLIVSSAMQRPSYTSTATLRVILDPGVAELRLTEASNLRLLNTYKDVLQSEPVISNSIQLLSAPLTVDEVRNNTTVTVVPDTELISVSVRDAKAARARDMANTLANQLIAYVQGLYTSDSKSTVQILSEQLTAIQNDINADRQRQAGLIAQGVTGDQVDVISRTITIKESAYDSLLSSYETARLAQSFQANSVALISPAVEQKAPPKFPAPMDLGLGFAVGLVGGLIMVSGLEKTSTRIHSTQQVETLTGLPVLAAVPSGSMARDQLRSMQGEGRSDRISESYRLLSINVTALQKEHPTKTILITSPASVQNKSAVATNLARTLAEQGQTTFLVEGDLRYPAIDKAFGVSNGFNLGALVSKQASFYHAALEAWPALADQPNLFVIGAGEPTANPAAVLASPAMNGVIDYLRGRASVALLDSPPVLMASDASVLASKTDGVILVIKQSSTKRTHLLAAIKQLRASGANILGLVFVRRRR